MINLGQDKAFDRVDHVFLQRILERFNFGPHFRRWVEVIYTNTACEQALGELGGVGGGGGGRGERVEGRKELAFMSQEFEFLRRKKVDAKFSWVEVEAWENFSKCVKFAVESRPEQGFTST